MKKLKALILSLTAALCACFATACMDTLLSTPSFLPTDSSVESSNEGTSETPETPEEDDFGKGYETITIAQALELCGEPGNLTEERYYIIGKVETISNPSYGEMTISDATGSIYVYGTYSADGELTFAQMTEKPSKGDTVLLHCTLQNHNGTKEVKNARLIDFKKAVIDESDYVEMSIADARTAAAGALIKISGVVAQITYANGFVPSGVMLIDETGSMYVYGSDIAGGVKEGNTITVLGTKDYWILETEKTAAAKFGYTGCNQLTDATLVSNDGKESAFPTTAIQETTVKAMMETPVTEDCTTIVYKVNALVTKADGNGFINYYFDDIDGETGSYTYTQCNGNDFTWLDEFDGKICTVYLTVLNAKSTATGCVYRFLPVDVKYENYQFDTANAAQFAVEYYGANQFLTRYTADPALKLNTVVSSELLGFENATLSYMSSNTEVVYFETVEDGIVMHCGAYGKATVTVTGAYNGKTYQETVEISVEEATIYDAMTVAEAIEVAVDTENVIVKGIVGPSVVNKNGFYLFGEDGSVISVLVNETTEFVGLEIGHEVILQGMRERYVKDDANTIAGQTCIVNAVILANNYGNHAYSTEKFVETTAADFYKLDVTKDYSTTVFVLKATIEVIETDYYTKLAVKSGSTELSIYCSGAGQYSWLFAYKGKEVTLEIAACNWNDKGYWAGCVLAVRNEDGTKTLNNLNFNTY